MSATVYKCTTDYTLTIDCLVMPTLSKMSLRITFLIGNGMGFHVGHRYGYSWVWVGMGKNSPTRELQNESLFIKNSQVLTEL